MGDMELNSVTIDTLESFRIHLVDERGLALKTARNIIDGSLKAMFRDAGRRAERNPMRSFIFGSGQEPGQVNAQRLNGEASICKAVKRRFRFPGTWAKRTRLRREQAVGRYRYSRP